MLTLGITIRIVSDEGVFSNCWTDLPVGSVTNTGASKGSSVIDGNGVSDDVQGGESGVTGIDGVGNSAGADSSAERRSGTFGGGAVKKSALRMITAPGGASGGESEVDGDGDAGLRNLQHTPSGGGMKQAPNGLKALLEEEEEQLAAILRMRSLDVLSALDRCQRLARRIHSSRNMHSLSVPPALQNLRSAVGISRWLFETLTLGLVKVSPEEGRGKAMIVRARELLQKARELEEKGMKKLESIDGYSFNGKHSLNVGLLGEKKAKALAAAIAEGESILSNSRLVTRSARDLESAGKELLPKLPSRAQLKRHFEKLYRLAVLQTTLGKDLTMLDEGGVEENGTLSREQRGILETVSVLQKRWQRNNSNQSSEEQHRQALIEQNMQKQAEELSRVTPTVSNGLADAMAKQSRGRATLGTIFTE